MRVRRGQALWSDMKKIRRCVGRGQIRIGRYGTSCPRRDVSPRSCSPTRLSRILPPMSDPITRLKAAFEGRYAIA